jgi:hypothetical protein
MCVLQPHLSRHNHVKHMDFAFDHISTLHIVVKEFHLSAQVRFISSHSNCLRLCLIVGSKVHSCKAFVGCGKSATARRNY